MRERLAGEHAGVDVAAACDAVLERADLDAVFVYADNRTSVELAVRALDRDLPTMLEKPMAADLAGADALLAAARAGGVPLMVNWPTAWRPAVRHGPELAAAGAVGEPVQLSCRGGHAGPREHGQRVVLATAAMGLPGKGGELMRSTLLIGAGTMALVTLAGRV